jgi:hypothetical protein
MKADATIFQKADRTIGVPVRSNNQSEFENGSLTSVGNIGCTIAGKGSEAMLVIFADGKLKGQHWSWPLFRLAETFRSRVAAEER